VEPSSNCTTDTDPDGRCHIQQEQQCNKKKKIKHAELSF
jgi:hypothetical protein